MDWRVKVGDAVCHRLAILQLTAGNPTLRIDGGQSKNPPMHSLQFYRRWSGALSRTTDNNNEHETHCQDRPQPHGLETSLAASAAPVLTSAAISHQCRLKPWHGKGVFYEPNSTEDDEIHHAQETCEHACNNANEGQLEYINPG